MADEPSKTQTTDKSLAKAKNVKTTDTSKVKTGETVKGAPETDTAALNQNVDGSPVAEGTVADAGSPPQNTSGVNQPGTPVNSDTSASVDNSGDKQLSDAEFDGGVRNPDANDAATSEAKVTRDVVPAAYRQKYTEGNGTCGDFIANELSSMTKVDDPAPVFAALKAENDIPPNKWNEFNNGMKRMNLANVLRGSFLRGETISIGGKQYSLAAALVEFEGEGDDRSPIALDDAKEVGQFIKMIDMQDTERTRAAIIKAIGPKPEKKPVKTAEEKAAEKKAKDEAKAKERDDAKAKREAERADAKKKREDEAAEKKAKRDAEAAAKKKERDEAAQKKADQKKADEDRAKTEAAAAKASDGTAADDTQKVKTAAANKDAAAKPTTGATK